MKSNLRFLIRLATLALAFLSFSAQAGTTSYFIYDESGHVIGEYDASGNPVQEHVYLGDRPVAVVQGGSSSGGTVDYVTTDQLNTPRVITDSSQTVLWSWNSDPFGNGNPTGSLAGNVPYNLRFPGQYYDAETGHNYNNYRDYDPSTGRYIESDPIGLEGGINTYAYAYDNSLAWEDPAGTAGVLPSPIPLPIPPMMTPAQSQAAALALQNAFNTAETNLQNNTQYAGQLLADWWWNVMHSEPVLPDVNPGRDCKGNCKPCPPPVSWYVPSPGHGHPNGYWHIIKYNQDPATCMCYADRPSRGLPGH